MQLLCSAHDVALNRHGVEWIKILENILFVVNADRIEAATKGDWTTIISRCLCHLLDGKSVHFALTFLFFTLSFSSHKFGEFSSCGSCRPPTCIIEQSKINDSEAPYPWC